MSKEKELLIKARQSMKEKKEEVADDYYRLQYHIMPPAGLLNDPNGFIHFDGEYHLFHQLYPFDTTHGSKFWAHLKSTDLVNWQELPLALAPANPYESHGCYSGSAVDNDGTLTLIYTGNVKDEADNRETYQCLAVTEDGINFNKLGPVIKNQPTGYTRHFRDPKVWQKDGQWYMVIGTQTIDQEGRVLLFTSADLKEWELVGEVAGSNLGQLDDFGYMWECPDLFRLDDKEVLIAAPQGVAAEENLYNNIYQNGYLVGDLDYQTGQLEHNGFRELDQGFDFYASQTTLDEQGRRILLAWMGLPDQEEYYVERDNGWVHTLTIPRVLELGADNQVLQKPVSEMKKLRGAKEEYHNLKLQDEIIKLAGINGDVLELIAEFEIEDAAEFGVKLRCAADGSEETVITYDQETSELSFDRSNSGRGEDGVRRCEIDETEQLQLHFFMDTSSIELFVNDGKKVFTTRIYPQPSSQDIKFFAHSGAVKLNQVRKWELNN
ncbi:glycoside hydrolase family 32 protein [Halanaerobacter jeridensis]|uniref:Sucrose-6-phosphate hydrolase n=1 Tax=Halanaerobacter jeridensis TaxID=706427 RepID=A0A938XR58_9FIRM|nr:sucrose-6-phosphate hydrolase [Halanaerobacter jeridensis]MBM7556111.1 beta-fructofuranosidase [Halanaerobacter jeridensis]